MLKLKYINEKEEHLINFLGVSGHIATLTGNFPVKAAGFILSRENFDDYWDYSAFNTVYRVTENQVQFSDDGSTYIEPKNDVTVSASWSDNDDEMKARPKSIKVKVLVNDELLEEVTLNAKNEWKKKYEGVLAKDVYTIEADDVADYQKTVSGTSVSYYMDLPQPEEITIDDLALAVTEIYEMIEQNSSDIVDTQLAVAEIYEIIGE